MSVSGNKSAAPYYNVGLFSDVGEKMKFELDTTDGRARRGRLVFDRGVVETPAFMPVGTYGTVKE